MKKWNFLFLFIFLCTHLPAQKTSSNLYIFKKDGSPATNIKEASFLQQVLAVNDTTYVSRYYNFAGPMIVQETFRDSDLTIPNGQFCWYNASGKLDSSGGVIRGKKNGGWEYIISKNVTRQVKFENGVKVKEDIFHYDDNGKYIPADTSKEEDDPTQKEAVYKNGVNDWVKYIQKNIHTPERLQNVLSDGVHTCVVSFLVDKEGYTKEIYLKQSCEWSGDAEAMRLITESSQWHPAIQKGKPVIYRQLQPISFSVQSR